MATDPIHDLFVQFQHLAPDEQRRLLKLLRAHQKPRSSGQSSTSILELRGLGKDLWQGIDAQEYVDQERSSWSG